MEQKTKNSGLSELHDTQKGLPQPSVDANPTNGSLVGINKKEVKDKNMSGVNKVILVGRLGNDPEIRYTQGGAAVANFNIATSENWTDREGQKQERTEWHRIVVWGKMAETCSQFLGKGRQVFVEGRLQTRQWDDKDGNKRYTTEVIASTVQFLDRGNAENTKNMDSQPMEASGSAPIEEDIPF